MIFQGVPGRAASGGLLEWKVRIRLCDWVKYLVADRSNQEQKLVPVCIYVPNQLEAAAVALPPCDRVHRETNQKTQTRLTIGLGLRLHVTAHWHNRVHERHASIARARTRSPRQRYAPDSNLNLNEPRAPEIRGRMAACRVTKREPKAAGCGGV